MENLEEVLQALDEFQKMRPSEIPRELEDYLCWVAKTGDPVYQWPLIKTLFREKLTRVMTDFYESCPTLELASCPNVEHFNYDTMKSNLLERLESFANAPFTVQRICELLTAPRKEYNRVDKFMRAIEKNILVVSTREPGPISRRNENGDGMVNGSVDEDTSVNQPPQDVEMEYWEKDCPSTVTISVHTVENESPMLHTVIPSNTVVKNVFGSEEASHEKTESTSPKSEVGVSNFMPATSEFSSVPNLTSQAQPQDSQIGHTIQNLSTIVPEASGIVGDVPEAIMNEDTSSQPSLDLENEEGDTTESTRKLQTTFQTKDFSSTESKSSKFYIDNSKVNEKPVQDGPTKGNEVLSKSDTESTIVLDNKESINPIVENLINTSHDNLENTTKTDAEIETMQAVVSAPVINIEAKEVPLEKTNVENISTSSSENSTVLSTGNTMHRKPECDVSLTEDATAGTSEDVPLDVESLKDQGTRTELSDDPKPLVEEPSSKDLREKFSSNQEKDNLTITEAVEDETRVIKSMVPDPIPIVEEPKDSEALSEKLSPSSSVVEITEESKSQSSTVVCESENKDNVSTADSTTTDAQDNNMVIKEKNGKKMENITKKGQESVELMDVDDEETVVYQQDDEPMEQEMAQSTKS